MTPTSQDETCPQRGEGRDSPEQPWSNAPTGDVSRWDGRADQAGNFSTPRLQLLK